MKENEHFTIHVTCNTLNPSKVIVSIRYQCGTSITLQQKPTGSRAGSKLWQLSNWSKHYKQCRHRKRPNTSKQDTLQSFFPLTQPIKSTTSDLVSQSTSLPSTATCIFPPLVQSSYPPLAVPSSQNMPRFYYSPYTNIPLSTMDSSRQMSSLTFTQNTSPIGSNDFSPISSPDTIFTNNSLQLSSEMSLSSPQESPIVGAPLSKPSSVQSLNISNNSNIQSPTQGFHLAPPS